MHQFERGDNMEMSRDEALERIRKMYELKRECRKNIKNTEQVIRDCDLIIEECKKYLKPKARG